MGMCVLIASLLISPMSMSKVQCPMSNVQRPIPISTLDIRHWNLDSYLVRLMMNVHRLDTNASWSSHAREVHTRAAEEAGS